MRIAVSKNSLSEQNDYSANQKTFNGGVYGMF